MACDRERLDGITASAPRSCNTDAKAIRVIALISEQVFERKTADQVFGLEDVVHLAWGQDEADGIAVGIDTNVYLRTQAAARTPDRLIFAPPFFAPAGPRDVVEWLMYGTKIIPNCP
jgi:hypothetical protein